MENTTNNFSEENFLFPGNRKKAFAVTEGYFDAFTNRLLNKIEHENELIELSSLTTIHRQLKFTVPKNYFSSLQHILQLKYETIAHPILNKVEKPVLKSLPTGYFEAFDKKLNARMELDNELKEFSVLSSKEKKNNFKLVPDYFENSTDEVKEKIHAKHESTNILEQIIEFIFKPKMAFALGLAVILGFTTIWYFNNKQDTNFKTGDCKTLACLEKNELLNDKNIPDFDDENLYEMVDVEMLDKQITKKPGENDSLKKDNKK